MTVKNLSNKLLMVILDGFGINDLNLKNAVSDAYTPNIDYLFKHFPHTVIAGSGLAVGLPEGVIGNSEVGHMNIGAGRRVVQDLVRINESIASGDFFKLELLEKLASFKRVHILGLVSDGGVHSHIDHIEAVIKYFADKNSQVFLHAFMDGRDTARDSGANFLSQLKDKVKIASVMGRFFSMDRDKRFERVEKAYNTMIGKGLVSNEDPLSYIKNSYKNGIFDEFIEPVLFSKDCAILPEDGVFLVNFRPDRAIELVEAFNQASFSNFKRDVKPAFFLRMTPNSEKVDAPILFDKELLSNGLSEYLSNINKKQLKIAETEKYAHVTFFFNGGRKSPFPSEEQILIPSPREVATYDLKPEMSALLVLEKLLEKMDDDSIDCFIVNFANSDMVGHTGNYLAAVKAVKTVDYCVGQLMKKVSEKGMSMILTADHGNSDQMIYENTLPHTSHTGFPVPLIIYAKELKDKPFVLNGKDEFALKDIAPTLLYIMGIEIPASFTGKPVFK